ncbi:MAG TPA: hypothetical protein VGM98_25195 [Schlesneria sp.]|jgi:hypothetical protein
MPLQPTVKDLVQFVTTALEYELLSLSEVVAWGDNVIASQDVPPTWALDLAMAPDLLAVGEILRQMEWLPGSCTRLMNERLLLGLLRRCWINSIVDSEKAKSTLGQMQLHYNDHQAYGEFVDIEAVRRLLFREYLEDFPHCDDVPWQLGQIFASCQSLDELLPDWI